MFKFPGFINFKKTSMLFCASLLAASLNAQAVELKSNEALSLSEAKASINLSLNTDEELSDLSKKAKIKIISSDKKLVKIKPKLIKFNSSSSETKTNNFRIFSQARKLSKISEEQTVTLTVKPNKAAKKAGIEESTLELTIIPGETESISVQSNFSGQSLLPLTSSNLKFNSLPEFEVNNAPPLFLDPGVPTTLNLPANAGSCALGLGGSPLSTETGPGGSDTSTGSQLRYGSGSSDDPLYIVFNNPNNGGENLEVNIFDIPAELISESGVPGFAQIFEGPFGTGSILATLEGTAVLNKENQSFDLSLADGSIISYSKDGSKSVSTGEIASTLNDIGVSINDALGFLQGNSIPISVPANIVSTTIENEMRQDSSISNPVVTLNSDLNGSMSLVGNNINGTFSASGSISFDIAIAPDLGTQTLTGTDNFQMTITAESPAIMTGFALKRAKGSLVVTNSDSEGVLQRIDADFEINDADISINSGINSNDITITNVEITLNQASIPSEGDIPVDIPDIPDSGEGDEEQAQEECLNQCSAQGGDTDFCNNLCSDL